ncbi:DUF302 domain-containing protein [Sulfurimonas sp. CVO]|uniref:DUF302 domain-containing protein n=1 Tax=Sulfurimonas xiamenensis TaxID=2590021 RepID=A0AAJ4A3U1_9BACT|nr:MULTISPECIES: DUF302 domain-containing protein [Sulfurimonas]QFR43383.1 DUF302 domain-containing protein [Sulfurimonas xiamenensis]QHG91049.1 DUF302 domain-containing protein [Sulfurimonas sp. CVO]
MNFLKNILSIIGAIVIIGALVVFVKYNLKDKMDKASKLDPKAMSAYMNMFNAVLTTGRSADAMVRRVKIDPDVSTDDVIESMNSIAGDANMLQVGDSRMAEMYDHNGERQRYIRILHYCAPNIAKTFIDYSEAYGAFMPCRILIVEDDNGDRWLMTMAMELMLFGGHTLPPEMMKKAEHVRDTMYKMMDLAAKGDF